MVINRSFILFENGFVINNVGKDLILQNGMKGNEMFTNKDGMLISVDIKQFHIVSVSEK